MLRIGVIVGSIAKESINKKVAATFPSLTDKEVEFHYIDISQLPLYSYDYDADYPAVARDFKQQIADSDGIIFVTPEYSRSIPGALKNAMDWAARPWGQSVWAGKPVAIMGASGGPIGTAVAQQHLRTILGHYNSPTMGQPETFFRYTPDAFTVEGQVTDEAARQILAKFVDAAIAHIDFYVKARA